MIRTPLRTALILSLTMLVFALAGNAYAVEGKAIGVVSSFYGDVKDQHKGETEWIPAKLGLDVYPLDRVKTEIKSKVRLTFEDGSLLNLGESTELQIKEHIYSPDEQKRQSVLSMAQGKMRVLCQKLTGAGSQMQVETPTAVIGIRGTEFLVWVVSNELTTVICLSDAVYVRNIDGKVAGEVMLKPNEMTKVGIGKKPLAPTIVPEELRTQLEIDTAAFKMSPSSAEAQGGQAEPAVAAGAQEAVQTVETPGAAPLNAEDVLRTQDTQAPSLPPIPQDPADNPGFKQPALPEPPPPPQSPPAP